VQLAASLMLCCLQGLHLLMVVIEGDACLLLMQLQMVLVQVLPVGKRCCWLSLLLYLL
jgi:hypothetical protein